MAQQGSSARSHLVVPTTSSSLARHFELALRVGGKESLLMIRGGDFV